MRESARAGVNKQERNTKREQYMCLYDDASIYLSVCLFKSMSMAVSISISIYVHTYILINKYTHI